MKYVIRIYHYGVVTREERAQTKREAKGIYLRESALFSQYAQVVLDGKPLVTAQAERHFGVKGSYTQQFWSKRAEGSEKNGKGKG